MMTPSEPPIVQARHLQHTAGARRLDDQAVLRVSGEDARSWLNGQITNDVGPPAPGNAVYGLILNLNGKIMSDLWSLDRGDELLLVLPSARLEALAEYLDKFIIMEDVELEALDDAVVLTVQGPNAAEAVDAAYRALAQPPSDPPGSPAPLPSVWPCDRLGAAGRDVLVAREQADEWRTALERAAEAIGGGAVDESGWELARLRLARGRLDVDFGDWTLPQEAGLKHAVAFGKGCYQGQEAVVMLEHRGRPPKHLVQLDVEADRPPERDAPLFGEDGTRLGRITSAVLDPDAPGHVPALGYVKRGHANVGAALHVDGSRATVRQVLTG